MPEILTKHKQTVIDMLNELDGVNCGNTSQYYPPKILKTCRRNQFCTLPNGEFCIVDMNDDDEIRRLQQSNLEDFKRMYEAYAYDAYDAYDADANVPCSCYCSDLCGFRKRKPRDSPFYHHEYNRCFCAQRDLDNYISRKCDKRRESSEKYSKFSCCK